MDLHIQRTINDPVEQGALIEFYAAPDACLVCRALLAKVFEPHDSPVIPVADCTNETCRCDYIPVLPGHIPRFQPRNDDPLAVRSSPSKPQLSGDR